MLFQITKTIPLHIPPPPPQDSDMPSCWRINRMTFRAIECRGRTVEIGYEEPHVLQWHLLPHGSVLEGGA